MEKIVTPLGDDDASTRSAGGVQEAPLMTSVGLVEGEVLTYLETTERVRLSQLIRAVDSPRRLVLMGVGALVREGLVCAIQRGHDVEIRLKARVEKQVR